VAGQALRAPGRHQVTERQERLLVTRQRLDSTADFGVGGFLLAGTEVAQLTG
jgi:hypothetical protein